MSNSCAVEPRKPDPKDAEKVHPPEAGKGEPTASTPRP
jgi:hypothetical protein